MDKQNVENHKRRLWKPAGMPSLRPVHSLWKPAGMPALRPVHGLWKPAGMPALRPVHSLWKPAGMPTLCPVHGWWKRTLLLVALFVGFTGFAQQQQPAQQVQVRIDGIVQNFTVLMKQTLGDLGDAALQVLWHGMLWGVLAMILGVVLAVYACKWMRKRGWTQIEADWYRWVAWLWPALFIACWGTGLSWLGGWYGAGRKTKATINEERILDKALVNVWAALVLDAADYKIRKDVTAKELEAIIRDNTPEEGELTEQDWEAAMAEMEGHLADRPVTAWILELLAKSVPDNAQGDDFDPRALILLFLEHENLDEYLEAHPDAAPFVANVAQQMARMRQNACAKVDEIVAPNLVFGLALMVLPLIPLGVFLGGKGLWHWSRRPRES